LQGAQIGVGAEPHPLPLTLTTALSPCHTPSTPSAVRRLELTGWERGGDIDCGNGVWLGNFFKFSAVVMGLRINCAGTGWDGDNYV